uniref:non-specific serine/threonine protein kinase n=1 Tax=Cupiennius salei TaxID=6928 RepID=T1E1B8_CUPSA
MATASESSMCTEAACEKREPKSSRSGRTSPSHSSPAMRLSLKQLIQEKKTKKLKFYRNGDRYFKGVQYVLSLEKIRSFDALLQDLFRILVDNVSLPNGVRFIFSIDGKEKIVNLEQFADGGHYVCSSADHFIKLDYMKNAKPSWAITKKLHETQSLKKDLDEQNRESRDFIRPKVVFIIRNGLKPRKIVQELLNKKTAHTFDQVLNLINRVVKLDTGALRKVYTLSGKQVTSLADFFIKDEVFIAYGSEKCLEGDFELDVEEYRYLAYTCKDGISLSKYVKSCQEVLNIVQVLATTKRVSSRLEDLCRNGKSPCDSSRSSFSASPLLVGEFEMSHSLRPWNHSGLDYQNGHEQLSSPIPYDITQKYDIGKIIGDGNFAVVHECVNKITKTEYALKVIDKHKCKGKGHMIQSEVAILRHVRHVNIVQLIEEFDYENHLYLVMELVKGGDLFDAITTATKYTEKDASLMVHDLSSALCYLHSLNIVHRDIKPENLLVVAHEDGTRSLKLGDFGLAIEVKEPLYTICGTPTYVAPEILAETGYGVKVDIWAAGVITYILLCGFAPFISQDQEELFSQILAGKYEFPEPFWDDVSDSAKELITLMLKVNPDERFSASEVLNHPWVQAVSALDTDMQSAVSREITMHFDHKPKPSLKAAGIALIAVFFWLPILTLQ